MIVQAVMIKKNKNNNVFNNKNLYNNQILIKINNLLIQIMYKLKTYQISKLIL